MAGFGIYMGESIRKDAYIGEYKAEELGIEEAERRGTVYSYMPMEYLFRLNKTQELDSTLVGNKLRFINNDSLTPNCIAEPRLCNGFVRMGLFAAESIAIGEEIFFDYGYPPERLQYFRQRVVPKRKQGVAVKSHKNGKSTLSTINYFTNGILQPPSLSRQDLEAEQMQDSEENADDDGAWQRELENQETAELLAQVRVDDDRDEDYQQKGSSPFRAPSVQSDASGIAWRLRNTKRKRDTRDVDYRQEGASPFRAPLFQFDASGIAWRLRNTKRKRDTRDVD